MEHLGGPHFDNDLIGPDGKLSRFCKGGQHKANALAAQGMSDRDIEAKRQKVLAKRTKKKVKKTVKRDRKAQNASDAASNAALNKLAEAAAPGRGPAATQYIQDGATGGGSSGGFGLSSTRRKNTFGLGGGRSSLG